MMTNILVIRMQSSREVCKGTALMCVLVGIISVAKGKNSVTKVTHWLGRKE